MRGDGFVARKDNRGRNLRTGESQRKDGLYMYRYKDERTGRHLTDTQCKNMALNDLYFKAALWEFTHMRAA